MLLYSLSSSFLQIPVFLFLKDILAEYNIFGPYFLSLRTFQSVLKIIVVWSLKPLWLISFYCREFLKKFFFILKIQWQSGYIFMLIIVFYFSWSRVLFDMQIWVTSYLGSCVITLDLFCSSFLGLYNSKCLIISLLWSCLILQICYLFFYCFVVTFSSAFALITSGFFFSDSNYVLFLISSNLFSCFFKSYFFTWCCNLPFMSYYCFFISFFRLKKNLYFNPFYYAPL